MCMEGRIGVVKVVGKKLRRYTFVPSALTWAEFRGRYTLCLI